MSKVRIYELAKETGLPNKEVIRRLGELGVDAKSHSSTVEDSDAERFRDSLGRQREARRRRLEETQRREMDEYDLDTLQTPPAEAKARRILPPHLRGTRESARPAAARVDLGDGRAEVGAPDLAESARRFRPATTPFRPG
ncbi:MAG: translation initiation factor IF-2 N-terminal domain-containing protein, partial [Actinomycetota bacterium]|nr:translation initiation factor IF-2 N-terminal domain-containing protein [Actinomycetota bacterium]